MLQQPAAPHTAGALPAGQEARSSTGLRWQEGGALHCGPAWWPPAHPPPLPLPTLAVRSRTALRCASCRTPARRARRQMRRTLVMTTHPSCCTSHGTQRPMSLRAQLQTACTCTAPRVAALAAAAHSLRSPVCGRNAPRPAPQRPPSRVCATHSRTRILSVRRFLSALQMFVLTVPCGDACWHLCTYLRKRAQQLPPSRDLR